MASQESRLCQYVNKKIPTSPPSKTNSVEKRVLFQKSNSDFMGRQFEEDGKEKQRLNGEKIQVLARQTEGMFGQPLSEMDRIQSLTRHNGEHFNQPLTRARTITATTTTRHMLAENTRIKSPMTRLEYNRSRSTNFPEGNEKSTANPSRRLEPTDAAQIKQEHLAREDDRITRIFDTDVESLDDTTTLSADIQQGGHLSPSRSGENQRRETDQSLECQQTRSSLNHSFDSEDLQRGHIDSASVLHNSHLNGGGNDVFDEEMDDKGGSDGDSEGVTVGDDPKLSSRGMQGITNAVFVAPNEQRAFAEFRRSRHGRSFDYYDTPVPSGSPSNREMLPLRETSSASRNSCATDMAQRSIRSQGHSAADDQRETCAPVTLKTSRIQLEYEPKISDGTVKSTSPMASLKQEIPVFNLRPTGDGTANKRGGLVISDLPSTKPRPNLIRQANDLEEVKIYSALGPSDLGFDDLILNKPDRFTKGTSSGTARDKIWPHKGVPTPDYDKEQLSSMTYAELNTESFDHDPRNQISSALPAGLSSAGLSQKLKFVSDLSNSSAEERSGQRQAFFACLPIDQYEECGDLIVDQFASIVAKFKTARQKKRSIARDIEAEIERRELRVRGRVGLIEKDMGRLRRAGQDVIRGKGS